MRLKQRRKLVRLAVGHRPLDAEDRRQIPNEGRHDRGRRGEGRLAGGEGREVARDGVR